MSSSGCFDWVQAAVVFSFLFFPCKKVIKNSKYSWTKSELFLINFTRDIHVTFTFLIWKIPHRKTKGQKTSLINTCHRRPIDLTRPSEGLTLVRWTSSRWADWETSGSDDTHTMCSHTSDRVLHYRKEKRKRVWQMWVLLIKQATAGALCLLKNILNQDVWRLPHGGLFFLCFPLGFSEER